MFPSYFCCTLFLLFRGDTNLAANLEGENDCLSLEATNLDGEKDRRSLEAVDLFGDCLLKVTCLVGDLVITTDLVGDSVITTGGLLIFTWNFEAEADAGDLIKNLCGVVCCLVFVITGDFVRQNFGCCEELSDDRNKGFGKSMVFFVHGLFLGDTRFAKYRAFSLSTTSLFVGGETTLKLIRDRTRWSDGEFDSVRFVWNFSCFSLFLLALNSESSRFGLRFLCRVVNGVFGSSIDVLLVLVLVPASTISLANLLAVSISPMVSPTSIAGRDILFHSPVQNRV